MSDHLSLAEIRRRLGLDDHDGYWLYQQRRLYREARHEPLVLTGSGPFTVEQAIGWASRELDTSAGAAEG
jgi:hypothetical protein